MAHHKPVSTIKLTFTLTLKFNTPMTFDPTNVLVPDVTTLQASINIPKHKQGLTSCVVTVAMSIPLSFLLPTFL
jgi:hypothetical protein